MKLFSCFDLISLFYVSSKAAAAAGDETWSNVKWKFNSEALISESHWSVHYQQSVDITTETTVPRQVLEPSLAGIDIN